MSFAQDKIAEQLRGCFSLPNLQQLLQSFGEMKLLTNDSIEVAREVNEVGGLGFSAAYSETPSFNGGYEFAKTCWFAS